MTVLFASLSLLYDSDVQVAVDIVPGRRVLNDRRLPIDFRVTPSITEQQRHDPTATK